MLGESVAFLSKPTKIIDGISEMDITYPRIFRYLFFIGAFRGILEFTLSIFINKQQLLVLDIFRLGRGLEWLLEMPLPFILWNIITAYLMWAMISFFLRRGGSLLGGEADAKKIEATTALLMTLYATPPLFNVFHLIADLPLYTYFRSFGFTPYLGVGEVIEQLWGFALIFLIARRLLKLDKARAFSLTFAPYLTGYFLWILSGLVFTNLFITLGMPLALRSTYAILLFYSITMGLLTVGFLKY
jgi:hypothetical protein